MVVTVVWLDVVVVVEVALARVAVQIALAAEVALADVPVVMLAVGDVFVDVPKAMKFLITTSSAAAAGSSTSAPPEVT